MRTRIAILGSVLLSLAAAAGIAQDGGVIAAPAPPVSPAPEVFGTGTDSYTTVAEWEFTAPRSSNTWEDVGGNTPLKFATVANGFFNAPVHVPSGALLTYLEFDYCDDNPTEDLFVQLVALDFNNTVLYTLGSVHSSGAPGCTFGSFDVGQYGITVDNYEQRLLLQAGFGANADGTTRFAGAIVGYRLQVSPAPGVATFNDVPSGHPFFQYVEALNAAGITGGCGGGNYCPDAPLTRGQMAVFLSKALGLFWTD